MTVPMVGEQTVLQYLLNSSTKHLKVRLSKNPLPALLTGVVLTDLVECDFDGYASILDPPFDLITDTDTGIAEGLSFPLVWTAGLAITPQMITGMYTTLQDGSGPELLFDVQRVGLGYLMNTPGQTFGRKLRMLVANRAT